MIRVDVKFWRIDFCSDRLTKRGGVRSACGAASQLVANVHRRTLTFASGLKQANFQAFAITSPPMLSGR
jgi:hypothetical protein